MQLVPLLHEVLLVVGLGHNRPIHLNLAFAVAHALVLLELGDQSVVINVLLDVVDDANDVVYIFFELFAFLEAHHRDHVSLLVSDGIHVPSYVLSVSGGWFARRDGSVLPRRIG